MKKKTSIPENHANKEIVRVCLSAYLIYIVFRLVSGESDRAVVLIGTNGLLCVYGQDPLPETAIIMNLHAFVMSQFFLWVFG